MTAPNTQSEIRYYRMVLGGWWLAVTLLGILRMSQGDRFQAIVLILSGALTALLGVGLSLDRTRDLASPSADDEGVRLQKATTLFSLIAISTVVGCAIMSGALWWAVVECVALVWILPAAILPLAQAYRIKRAKPHTA